MNHTYYPEGMFPSELQCNNMSREQLKKAYLDGTILEGIARSANASHDLMVDLGCVQGMIPRDETAIGIADGSVRDIAILSRVGKPVCFHITSIDGLYSDKPTVTLSRRSAQQEALDYLLYQVPIGTVLPAVVTHLDRFGAFCDIGCGNVSLLSIEHISVSRINHSKDRFTERAAYFYCHSIPGPQIKAPESDASGNCWVPGLKTLPCSPSAKPWSALYEALRITVYLLNCLPTSPVWQNIETTFCQEIAYLYTSKLFYQNGKRSNSS